MPRRRQRSFWRRRLAAMSATQDASRNLMTEKQKIEIIPAVLPQSFKDLEAQLAPLAGTVRQAQVDVVDGRYARGKSWPYRDRASFERLVDQEHGLPFWDKIDFQFALMVGDRRPSSTTL